MNGPQLFLAIGTLSILTFVLTGLYLDHRNRKKQKPQVVSVKSDSSDSSAVVAKSEVKAPVRHTRLIIYLHVDSGNQSSQISWEHNLNGSEVYTWFWEPFLHWYFGRPQSQVYCFRHDRGATYIKRSLIRFFEIRRDVIPTDVVANNVL